jgi:hypothetical protein
VVIHHDEPDFFQFRIGETELRLAKRSPLIHALSWLQHHHAFRQRPHDKVQESDVKMILNPEGIPEPVEPAPKPEPKPKAPARSHSLRNVRGSGL